MHPISKKGRIKAFILIRDKYGRPKIDDVENCPAEIWDALTDEEKEELLNGSDSQHSST